MKDEELRQLLERYYNGESTEKEEESLRRYFNGNNIAEIFEAEREIFRFYASEADIPEPSADFKKRIIDAVDATIRKNTGSLRFRTYILPFLSAAAGLLILAGSYIFFINRSEPKDTFSDPEIAYAETMKIMLEVSSKLNHGIRNLEGLGKINEMTSRSFESLNKTRKLFEENVKDIGYPQKIPEISDMPIDKTNN